MMFYVTGKPYPNSCLGDSQCRISVQPDGKLLIELFYDTPKKEEIVQIKDGRMEIRCCELNDILFCCFRFGSLAWMDAPYWAIVSSPIHSILLCLVDCRTKILKVMREIKAEPKFINRFNAFLKKGTPYRDPVSYYAALQTVYDRYPTMALVALCHAQPDPEGTPGPEKEIKIRPSLKDLNPAMIHRKSYPSLPEELNDYHYYIDDGGHVIMAVPTSLAGDNKDLSMREVPIPVKYVLEKGYSIKNGYVIVDVPYGQFGIDEYEEY